MSTTIKPDITPENVTQEAKRLQKVRRVLLGATKESS
jgi:hypothetical protein